MATLSGRLGRNDHAVERHHVHRLAIKPVNLVSGAIMKSLVLWFAAWMGAAAADDHPPQSGKDADSAVQLSSKGTAPCELASSTIDHWIEDRWAKRGIKPAGPCDEAAFVRRVYLDLAGRIPSSEELATYLDDDRPDKRVQLVDELLADQAYAVHMADLFDTILMGRGGPKVYRRRAESGWRSYLEEVFAANRPWDRVARELLLARPSNATDKAATWFLYERNDKYQEIAEAVSSTIFGVQIQCAQCHDHPLASEVEQRHYWGLVGFFRRSKNVDTADGPRVSESAVGGFEEFANLSGMSQPNLLTYLQADVVSEPRPEAGSQPKDSEDLYLAGASASDPKVPKFSRRERFVDEVLPAHPLLARAMVNKLWALLLGRGLSHPHDKLDSMHSPSHPELLDALANGFVQSGYDIRLLVRAIVLSRPYQLDSRRDAGSHDPADFAWFIERPLPAEVWARNVAKLVRSQDTVDDRLLAEIREQFSDVLPEEVVTPLKNGLFLSNHQRLDEYLAESRDREHLTPRLVALPDHQARVNYLFRRAFARLPDDEELAQGVAYLSQREDRLVAALDQLVWSLMAGAEFRFQH